MNYAETGTVELRKLVRERGLANGMLVAGARKDDLIALLEGRITALPGLGQSAEQQPEQSNNSGHSDGLADVLANALRGKINAGVDAEQVKSLVREYTESDEFSDRVKLVTVNAPVRCVVENKVTGTEKDLGVQHEQFPKLLKFAQARDKDGLRLNIYLHGPAGTGKTTAAHMLAKALDLPYYFNGAIDSEYKLSGFVDAQGVFRSRPFFEAYSKGGVYLFDELDSSMASAVLAFNAALANGHADFPCGHVARHPDCVILAAGNTDLRGGGAKDGFIRNKMDSAFRDRFTFLEWPIDEKLEAAFVPAEYADWLKLVRVIRANIKRHGIRDCEATPRATFGGIALMQAGATIPEATEAWLRKGLSDDAWSKLNQN